MHGEITKSLIRRTILTYRKLLEDNVYNIRNRKVCDRLVDLLKNHSPKVIHTFLPISKNREVDVTGLLPMLWELGVEVIVPVTNFSEKEMKHFRITKETKLVANKLGIPEPIDAEEVAIENINLVLVPLTCGDRSYFRIGYGGGYYDRMLSQTNATKVGLLLTPLLDKIYQRDSWDIKLDAIITPNELIT